MRKTLNVRNSQVARPAMICHAAVFFNRPERFKPILLPRQQILDFINAGRYFAEEPKYKPSAKSLEMQQPQWFTLDVKPAANSPIQVRWANWNHLFPNSVEPLRNMAHGMAIDAEASDSRGLVQTVSDSTDAIWFYAAETDLSDDCRRMLADLQHFLLDKLDGVLFVPGNGLYDKDSQLTFPNNVRHPSDSLTFGKNYFFHG